MRIRWLVAGAVVALVGAGAVVAATDEQEGDQASSGVALGRPGPEMGTDTQAAPASMAAAAQRDVARSPTLPPPPSGGGPRIDQKVVKTADLTVKVGEGRFDEAFQAATGIATLHGGFVASSNTSSSNTSSSGADDGQERLAVGSLELRVPSASFEAARAALSKLGKVTNEQIGGQDVGGQLVDIEARLRSLSSEEDALRALMTRARTVGETIEVQRQLTNVREQIEQLTGQKARLDGAVEMSTIRATVTEPGAAVKEGGPSLARSFERAVEGALAVVGGTLVVLGYALPFGVLILLAWLLYRLALRRHRPAVSG